MPLTETERLDCQHYCLRNWRVRLAPRTSRVLVRQCLALMPDAEQEGEVTPMAEFLLRSKMADNARHISRKVRRPVKSVWLIILLQVVLPALIQLVIEWWLRRRSEA